MSRLLSASLFLGVAACGADHPSDSDAPPATCDGGDRLVMHGATELEVTSFGTITTAGRITGFNGSVADGVIALGLRDYIHFDLESDRDVALANLKYFRVPLAGCGAATCSGFFALAGTYHVVSVHPRYAATFSLSDLREHLAPDDEPGAAMVGQIDGCVDRANP